jgi:hypothetical protein
VLDQEHADSHVRIIVLAFVWREIDRWAGEEESPHGHIAEGRATTKKLPSKTAPWLPQDTPSTGLPYPMIIFSKPHCNHYQYLFIFELLTFHTTGRRGHP